MRTLLRVVVLVTRRRAARTVIESRASARKSHPRLPRRMLVRKGRKEREKGKKVNMTIGEREIWVKQPRCLRPVSD